MKPSEVILALTLFLGLVCLVDLLFFRKKRVMHSGAPSGFLGWLYVKLAEGAYAFFPVLLLVLILRSFVGEAFRIPSGSMHPTLVEGDFILVDKFSYGLRLPVLGTEIVKMGKPKRGDVVVFTRGPKDLIKRIVGIPGDHIEYKNKVLIINGKPVNQVFQDEILGDPKNPDWSLRRYTESMEEHLHDILIRPDTGPDRHYPYGDVVVPPGAYFVMGDNRDNSDDSRYWGFVPENKILGRAFGILVSVDWQKRQLRWHRSFHGIP